MEAMTSTGIAYDDSGAGEPALLFLPGWCGPRTLFEPLTARLDPRYRALALDWRGHGTSKPADGDFGASDLVDDAVAVIDGAGVGPVVPVAVSHAGWIAIELRRRLGPARVPRIVFLDWMILGAPPPLLGALAGMADLATTRGVVDQLTTMWLAGLDIPALAAYVESMAAAPDEMWARGAREIGAAFERSPIPLDTVADFDAPPPALHLFAQPADPAYLDAQRQFANAHPWFQVERLDATSHFPMFEVPDAIVDRLEEFVSAS